jgi:hypothetical protein
MIKVRSSLAELKATVAACELEGEWSENTRNGFHSFHVQSGEVLNWWPSTGTVQFQGKRREEFRALFSNCRRTQTSVVPKPVSPAAKLFVLRSREHDAWDQVELDLVLLRLGFQSVALQKVDDSGEVIVEAFNQCIHRNTGVGIAILTAED